MKLTEAIAMALDFERKVRDHYERTGKAMSDPVARNVFAALANEEQGHVEYLEHCLAEWKRTGKIPSVSMRSVLPKGVKWIEAARAKLSARAARRCASDSEIDALKVALQHEKDGDGFYRRLVRELPEEEQGLFAKFLTIEDGHLALVQAQLDSVLGTGFWFDVMEFRLEAE